MSVNLRKNISAQNRPQSLNFSQNEKREQSTTGVSKAKSMKVVVGRKPLVLKRTESLGPVEELVQCEVCLERLTQPKMLPCQHTFCFSCLESQVITKYFPDPSSPSLEDIKSTLNQKQLKLSCPNCKKEMIIEDGINGLEKLPTNIYIDYLLNAINSENISPTSAPIKNNIDDIHRCVKCQTVCNFDAQRCQHCKLNFCMVCWPKHADELQSNFSDFLKRLEDYKNRLKCEQEDHERIIKQRKDCVKIEIEDEIVKIKEKEIKLLQEIDNRLVKGSKTLKDMENKINVLEEEIKNSNVINADNEKVSTYMKYHTNMSKLSEEISRFAPTRDLDLVDLSYCKLSDSNNDNAFGDDDLSSTELVGNALGSESNLIIHYKTRTFTTKLSWSKCPKPAGVGVPPWASDLVYIAATDSKTVFILNKAANKVVGRLTHQNMRCPQSVAFCKNNKEIFVSDKWAHCVHVFSYNGDYLRVLASRGREAGQVISPQGLALSDKGELFVCDSGNDRVLILDPFDGHQLATIGLNGTKTALNMPTGVAVYKDKVIIADVGNHRIKIYEYKDDAKYEMIKEIGSMGKDKGQFRCAEVVAVDPRGFIFVGDAGNARVQIYDSDGNFVRMFEGSKSGKFNWVSGIFITPELDIITTDYKKKCLTIF